MTAAGRRRLSSLWAGVPTGRRRTVVTAAVVVCLALGVLAAAVVRSALSPGAGASPAASRPGGHPTSPPASLPAEGVPDDEAPSDSGLPDGGAPADRVPGGVLVLPPVPARADYQLGGAYDPDPSVGIVVRDRTAEPVPGLYNICYVNAYQTQPDEADLWSGAAADLVLRDAVGAPVVDEEWDELILDTSTSAKRQRLADVVGPWVDGCAAAGFQAVELDNLDTWTRSGGRLKASDNLAYASLLVSRAHGAGLVVAQKNAAGLGSQGRAAGFDFAVAEDCQVWSECDAYTEVYDAVIEVEYTDRALTAACAARGSAVSVLRRDLDLVPRGERGYVARWC